MLPKDDKKMSKVEVKRGQDDKMKRHNENMTRLEV